MLTTGLFSDSPTSLTPKTKYYYQACGIYQSNAEVCGAVLFFTTLDSTTGGTNDLWDVTTFAATAVTATDAELNGEVTVTEGTTCSSGSCFVTYFQFGPYDASGIFTTTLSNPGTQGAAAFRRGATGLTPNTQYQYEACADYVNDLNVTVTKCNPIRYFTTLAKDTDLCPNTPGLQDQAYLDAHNGACTDGSGDLCPDVPGIQTQAYLDTHNGSCTNGPDNPTDGGGSPIITGGGGKVITTIGIITGALSIAVSVNPALVSTVPEAWSLLLVSFGLLKRGKKRGVIYDSVTKAPIPNVFVELIDQNGKQIETAITDTEGRYDFLVPPGAYTIHVKKDGYVFPSMLLGHVKRDELYLNLYFGNYIEVTKNENVIAVNVPVDPIIFNQDEVRKHEEAIAQAYEHRVIIFNRVSDILFGIGIIVSLVAFIVSPNIYNIVVFGIYIALLIGKEVGVSLSKLGTIVKKDTGQPLSGAIIRVFSATMGNEVIHKVTTETGKFYCLIPNGTYIVTIEEKHPDGTYTKVFTSTEFVVEKGTIRGTWGV